MNLDRFINRPVLSTVISVFIVILGVISLISLPVSQYPDIAPPTIQVSTVYSGANAQTVLNSVLAPLEEQINGVENMDYMTSTATNNGTAVISIVFKQGTDPNMAAVNVQNRVSMAAGLMPAEVTQVGVITNKRQTGMLMVFALYDSTDKYETSFLENYSKINLVPQVQRVKGVGEAQVFGADYSMRIWLDPDKMAQYHLMPSDVTMALASQNIEAAPGSIGERENQTFEYTLRYKGRLQEATEFEDIVINALPTGQVLRLKDIARVELGRSTYAQGTRTNGHKGVVCMVTQTAGSNATEIIHGVEKVLDEAKTNLPEGLEIAVIMNANDFLNASIHEVIKTLIEAFILVFIVVYIFLQDLRSTLIPSIAIPVALVGTFIVLSLVGYSLNLLTLSALVLAIAIVVDDAIVVVEGVHAKLDQGYVSARKASIDAMRELGGAIVSITFVMMAVFIPVSFMAGTSGIFYRQFGMTMAISIAFSAINALTLSPALCALFLQPHRAEEGHEKQTFVSRFHHAFNAKYDVLLAKYKKVVLSLIKKPILTMVLVGVSVTSLIVVMNVTPTALVPNEDTRFLLGSVVMPPGTSQDRTEKMLEEIDKFVAASPAVETRSYVSGFSIIGGQGSSYGSFFIRLKHWDERGLMERADIQAGLMYLKSRDIFKDAQVLFFAPPMIPGYGMTNGFDLNLQDRTGGSLDKFFQVAKDFQAELMKRPEVQTVQTNFNPNFPQYMVDIDAAACLRAGIQPKTILTTLQGYLGGTYASNFNRFGKMYRVYIQAERSERTNVEALKRIKIRNGAEMAPITQFMSLKRVYGPDVITRFNLYTAISLNGTPAQGYSTGQAIAAVKEVAAKHLPQGYSYEFANMSREEASTTNTTALVFVLCFVFIYLLLSAQYESYLLPLSVLLSVPFGLLGSFAFIHLLGAIDSFFPISIIGGGTNNIYVQIALIMLMGLLAKNAILIVEFAVERRRMGMSITWAAVLGAGARLRPILMTSIAMIVGLLPLLLAFGVGASANRSLGAASIGGMLIGMILQVWIVPSLFVIFQYLQEKVSPMKWEDVENPDALPDLKQYSGE